MTRLFDSRHGAGIARKIRGSLLAAGLALLSAHAQGIGWEELCRLTPGRVRAENALWIENQLSSRFNTSKRVVVADLSGPAVITMVHFAMPQSHFGNPVQLLGRELLLRAFWDGEETPSVEVPLVDFFCDPNGLREEVNTALVNKRRGYNAYFPMPFRKSARIELVYDGPVDPGDALWRLMPCYSYVMYRTVDAIPADSGNFHASWRQEALLLGTRDYLALDARGQGKFVGWNVTMRLPGRESYPVDQNEKFYVDGEPQPAVEFQGIEDSFGFSWGFPATESQFPLTGFYRFMKGAMGYRFFVPDAISFGESLRVSIGFGANEDPMFRREYSKRGNTMQFSSTVYWYQTEPHAPFPPLLPAVERAPAPELAFWPDQETLPAADELRARHVRLHMRCGRPTNEVLFAEPGYGARSIAGYSWNGWGLPVSHCRAGDDAVEVELTVPAREQGRVRVFVVDPDRFGGGRRQTVSIAGHATRVEDFVEGLWIEQELRPEETAEGRLTVRAVNHQPGSNATLSILEWVRQP
ncbi:MAG TPA: DUF2961 domain-containing protein [Verrucomicrobiota bacterium]|nr:DUF2961 domain-containing protein [Verrucomicrobiota bacterium]HNU52153.1 DUF2961 domain-containing protein [Verrucomicrobiota bacterium]